MRAVLVTAFALLLAAPAQAAPTVVAADGRLELRAEQTGGRLCLQLAAGGETERRTCDSTPRSPYRGIEVDRGTPTAPYAAAVDPDVAAITLERRGGEMERYETVAVEGFAARFVLVAAAGRYSLARFLGADGTMLGATAVNGLLDSDDNRTVLVKREDLRLTATTEPALEPTPLAPDRVVTRTCLSVRSPRTISAGCDYFGETLTAEATSGCGARALVFGSSVPAVRKVRIVLGDGRRLEARTRPLPAAFGGRRYFAQAFANQHAVRSVAALGAGGRTVGVSSLSRPPGLRDCSREGSLDGGGFGFFVDYGSLDGSMVATAGNRELLAADRGDRLCVGLVRLRAFDCSTPPVSGDSPVLERRGQTLGGVLAQDVATIEVRFGDGEPLRVPTTEGAAYTGAYAGRVRFVALELPMGRRATRAVAFDADGVRLGSEPIEPAPSPQRVERYVAGDRRRGGVALIRGGFGGPERCFGGAKGRRLNGLILCRAGQELLGVNVTCGPARAAVYGAVPEGARGAMVILAGGRAVQGRTTRAFGQRLWAAIVPPQAAVEAVRFGAEAPVAFEVPPAADECGYTATGFL